jgi:hypothetical protein
MHCCSSSMKKPFALLNLLTETIENDRYPLSPRIRALRGILTEFGPIAPAAGQTANSGGARREPAPAEPITALGDPPISGPVTRAAAPGASGE